jgi:hypothetical protein
MVSAQGLWRQQRQRSDCSVGVGAVIVVLALVGAVIVASALVGAVIVASALVGAAIAVAASAQLLQGRCCSDGVGDCGGGVGAAIAGAAAQLLRWRWRNYCSDGGVCAGIMAAAASVQRLRLRRRCNDCSYIVGWRSDCCDGGVCAAVAAMGLVGHSSDCGSDSVGTGIAVTAALACGNGGVGAMIVVAASAQ